MGGILPIVIGALGAVGQYQQAAAQTASYKAQAAAEQMNAQIAGINADIAQSEGTRNQALAAEEAYKSMGRQRAAQAQTGILNSATGLLMRNQSETAAADEQLRIGRQADMEALNYTIQRSNALNSSSILSSNAKSAKTGGVLGAAGSLLGGVGQGYSYRLNTGGWM